jgi:hypothetical protein
MEGIRFRRPLWNVMRFAEDTDGRVDDQRDVASFWEEAGARDEATRLNQANADRTVSYEVVQVRSAACTPPTKNRRGCLTLNGLLVAVTKSSTRARLWRHCRTLAPREDRSRDQPLG